VNVTVFLAQREPPYAAVVAVILLAVTALGLARSWWRRCKYPIFATRKKSGGEDAPA
jgi:hypothetical protein